MKKKIFCLLLITISIISLSTIIANAFMFTPSTITPPTNPTTTVINPPKFTVSYIQPKTILPSKPITNTSTTNLEAQVAKLEAKVSINQAKVTQVTVKSKSKKKINVTWKKINKAKGYEVQVAKKKNFKKLVYDKFTKKTKLTIKKLKSKKTYFVRVRAYATYQDVNNNLRNVYGSWSKKTGKKIKVK